MGIFEFMSDSPMLTFGIVVVVCVCICMCVEMIVDKGKD